jgi:hypothetical protein
VSGTRQSDRAGADCHSTGHTFGTRWLPRGGVWDLAQAECFTPLADTPCCDLIPPIHLRIQVSERFFELRQPPGRVLDSRRLLALPERCTDRQTNSFIERLNRGRHPARGKVHTVGMRLSGSEGAVCLAIYDMMNGLK